MFTTHLAPVFLARVPRSHLARLQAVLVLAQVVPLLLTNNLVGAVASYGGARSATLACAGMCVVAGLLLLRSRRVRDCG